jgi:hypothetical protein
MEVKTYSTTEQAVSKYQVAVRTAFDNYNKTVNDAEKARIAAIDNAWKELQKVTAPKTSS